MRLGKKLAEGVAEDREAERLARTDAPQELRARETAVVAPRHDETVPVERPARV